MTTSNSPFALDNEAAKLHRTWQRALHRALIADPENIASLWDAEAAAQTALVEFVKKNDLNLAAYDLNETPAI